MNETASDTPIRETHTHRTGGLVVTVRRTNGVLDGISIARHRSQAGFQAQEAPGVANLNLQDVRNLMGILDNEGV